MLYPKQCLAWGRHSKTYLWMNVYSTANLFESTIYLEIILIPDYTRTCVSNTALPVFMKEGRNLMKSLSMRNHERIMKSLSFSYNPFIRDTKLCWDRFPLIVYKPIKNYSENVNQILSWAVVSIQPMAIISLSLSLWAEWSLIRKTEPEDESVLRWEEKLNADTCGPLTTRLSAKHRATYQEWEEPRPKPGPEQAGRRETTQHGALLIEKVPTMC